MNKQFIQNTIIALLFGFMMSKLWMSSTETVIFIIATLCGQLWLQIMQNKKVTISVKPYQLSKFAKEMKKFKNK